MKKGTSAKRESERQETKGSREGEQRETGLRRGRVEEDEEKSG